MVKVLAFDESKYQTAFGIFVLWVVAGSVGGILAVLAFSFVGTHLEISELLALGSIFGFTLGLIFAALVISTGFYTVEVKEVRKK